ncbi:MAG: hypothetical protein ACFFDB_00915 [Promethearchaeota archaeon]
MKFLKRDKRILLIFLISFPMIMILGSSIINAKGGPFIPEPHADNDWHWEVDVGDQMYFEGKFIIANASTGEITMMWKDIWIYNITSIENVTVDWLGSTLVSQVNATQNYYNVTSAQLVAYGPSSEIALFGYNSTDPITHRIRAGMSGLPLILPINGTSGLQVDILDDIINETYYTPMAQMGIYNLFDFYFSNPISNNIYFSNSTDNFFTSGFYYNNGTLNTGSAYMKVQMGNGTMTVNATMTQVFDYDITDEVQWGVNIGDTFVYDWYDGSDWFDIADEVLVNITDISEEMFEKNKNGFSEEPIQMAYQIVSADLFLWNGTDYEQVEWDIPVGIANNFYPQYFDMSGPNLFNFLYPISAGKDDFLFMWNNDTLRIWEAPFDEFYYTENGYFESYLVNSTGNGYVWNIVDKATGIVQSNLMVQDSNVLHYEIKTQTLVNWSVNVGDTIYYKNNGEEFQEIRATITGLYNAYANMSAMIEYYATMGITINLPMEQPEFQFFSYLDASFELWDAITQSWIPDTTHPFVMANIYWPISPMSFQFGPPLLLPEGTTSSELNTIFDFFGDIYDDIIYSPGYVAMTNTTLDRTLHFHFNETTGRVNMMYGWNKNPGPVSQWSYMSIYPKFYRALNIGSNSFTMKTDFPTGIVIDFDLNISGTGEAIIYNFFDKNPVNVSLPEGTPLGYFDQLHTNYTAISGNITMTITLPPSINVSEMIFFFYAYNMSGSYNWDAPPPEFYLNSVTFDTITNSIIIEMEPFMFYRGIVSGIAYVSIYKPSDFTLSSTADDPDDDGNFDLTWTSSTLADSYNIYQYDSFITEINGSLTTVATGVTSLTFPQTGYTNGTYYFIVEAVNSYGVTISNCIVIIVAVPPSAVSREIPGYDLFLISLIVIMVSGLFIKKFRKKK